MTELDPMTLALKQIRTAAPRYQQYDRYYGGDHPLSFATSKFTNAFGATFRAFALNMCPAVVDAMADRLVVTGVENQLKAANSIDDDEVETAAWDIWRLNRMDRRSGEVHQEALKEGDAYLIVWPDRQGTPRFWPERAASMTVHYDEGADVPDVIDWAAKVWFLDDGRCRMTMYYPDRLEKYVTISTISGRSLPERASAFAPYLVPGERWPLANPWGRVPVFHFANNDGIGVMGESELKNVIPVQNALNKSVTDMLVASEYAAFRQRWATGIDVPTNPDTGQPVEVFKAAVDRVWMVGDPEAKFGEFSAADLEQMRLVVDGFKVDIASVHGVPLHYFNLHQGDFPSGESLKTAEARFVKRVTDRQIAFGNCWEDALAFALRITGVGGELGLSILWQDASPRSEREMAEVGNLKRAAGVSLRQVLRELGYSVKQVEEMLAENAEADDRAMEEAMTRFDRGLLAGGERGAA